jgi:CDP-4-dehydro-6-deoxyglucose reductase/ferredoxin-NAD(P)+ reductase (naphthalene dioxygenase ferredoxin-specific)
MNEHPVVQRTARVEAIVDATHDVRIVRLVVDGDRLTYSAGQFVRLSFADFPARDYSIANAPGLDTLEFHIRRESDEGVSGHVARALAVGDRVDIDGPHGAAYLRPGHTGPLIAIAGGSGLAPMKSIVEAALKADHPGPIWLFFGVRKARDLYLTDYFESIAADHRHFRFVLVLSEPEDENDHRVGLVGDVAGIEAPLVGAKTYIAGPPAMAEHAMAIVAERGVAPGDIHADPFYSEAEMVARGLRD